MRAFIILLLCIAAVGAAATRGVFAGSRIEMVGLQKAQQGGKPVFEWVRKCRYLHLNGTVERNQGVEPNVGRERAISCPWFDPN